MKSDQTWLSAIPYAKHGWKIYIYLPNFFKYINVGKYSIHGTYGYEQPRHWVFLNLVCQRWALALRSCSGCQIHPIPTLDFLGAKHHSFKVLFFSSVIRRTFSKSTCKNTELQQHRPDPNSQACKMTLSKFNNVWTNGSGDVYQGTGNWKLVCQTAWQGSGHRVNCSLHHLVNSPGIISPVNKRFPISFNDRLIISQLVVPASLFCTLKLLGLHSDTINYTPAGIIPIKIIPARDPKQCGGW